MDKTGQRAITTPCRIYSVKIACYKLGVGSQALLEHRDCGYIKSHSYYIASPKFLGHYNIKRWYSFLML